MKETCREAVISAFERLERRTSRIDFELLEVVKEVLDHTAEFRESTIRTHVSARMCIQAPENHDPKYDDLDRVGIGRYRRHISENSAETSSGNSQVQRTVEPEMVSWLSRELGCDLHPKRIELGDGVRLELDAYNEEPPIICEAWAHQGSPKSAQKFKVMNDAMKLVLARNYVGQSARAILLFADQEAAKHFLGNTWQALALRENRIEVFVAELSEALKSEIRAAQITQYR